MFVVANAINFAFIAAATAFGYGVPVREMLRSFVTALPSEFATGLLDRRHRAHLLGDRGWAPSGSPRS